MTAGRSLRHRRIGSSVGWATIESIVVGLISIVSVLVIVQLVTPAEYGQAALAMALVTLVEVPVTGGLIGAVIRHRSADTTVTDTAFWTRLGLAGLAVIICLIGYFPIRAVYDGAVANLLLLATAMLPMNALAEFPSAQLIRKLRVRRLVTASIANRATAFAGVVALAWAGFGAAALILGALAGSVVNAAILWAQMPRIPKLRFHRHHALELLRFSSVVGLNSFLWVLSTRAFLALFGYFHGSHATGLLNVGMRLVEETGSLIGRVAFKVGYPVLSETARLGGDLRQSYTEAGRLAAVFSVPVFTGMLLTAPFFMPLLFDSEWAGAVPIVQVLAAFWLFQGVRLLVPALFQAAGRQVLQIPLAVLDAGLSIGACVMGQWLDPAAAVALWCLRAVVQIPVETLVIRRSLGLHIRQQFGFAWSAVIASVLMAATVFAVTSLDLPQTAILFLSVTGGAATYIASVLLIDRTLRQIVLGVLGGGGAGRRQDSRS